MKLNTAQKLHWKNRNLDELYIKCIKKADPEFPFPHHTTFKFKDGSAIRFYIKPESIIWACTE